MSQLNSDQYVIVNLGTGTTTGGSILQNVFNASNLGGVGVFDSKSGNTLYFKGLVAGENITLTSSSTGITINSIGGTSGDFVSASTFSQYTGETSIALESKLNESIFNAYAGATELTLSEHENDIDTITTNYVTGGTLGLNKSGKNLRLGGALSGTINFTGSSTLNFGTSSSNRITSFNIYPSSQFQVLRGADSYLALNSSGFLLNTASNKQVTIDNQNGTGISFGESPSSTNTVSYQLSLRRGTTGTAANGIGTGIIFGVEHNANDIAIQGTLSHRLSNASSTNLSSTWRFTGFRNQNTAGVTTFFEFGADNSLLNTKGLLIAQASGSTQASSILELSHTGKTLTLSRISSEGNISTPIDGMIYYNSSDNKFRVREDSSWKNVATTDDLDSKLSVLLNQRNITSTGYTLTNSDSGYRLYLTGNTSIVYLPTGLTTGFQVEIMKESTTGTTVTLTTNTGVTLRSVNGANKMNDQYGVCLIVHKNNNVFTAHGNLIT